MEKLLPELRREDVGRSICAPLQPKNLALIPRGKGRSRVSESCLIPAKSWGLKASASMFGDVGLGGRGLSASGLFLEFLLFPAAAVHLVRLLAELSKKPTCWLI